MRIEIFFHPTGQSESLRSGPPLVYAIDGVPDRILEWVRIEIGATVQNILRLVSFSRAKGDF